MSTLTEERPMINSKVFSQFSVASKLSGYNYVGDYLEQVAFRELNNARAYDDLSRKLQEGIDSGFVETDKTFWGAWDKRMGVVKNNYED